MTEKKHSLGSLFSVPDLRDYRASASHTVDLPTSFELRMPEVKNQGSVGSCVAHAVALVTEYFNKKETGKKVKMSTGYIYGNRMLSLHKGSGMYTKDAIRTMTKYGDVTYDEFPHNVEVPYAIELFEQEADKLEASGLNYKFASYFKLKDSDAIKEHLLDGNPVIFSMYWFDDIKIKDGVMQTTGIKTKNTGGHCMVIYGWNETGWRVQNSWGKYWGKNGRFTLPYTVPVKEFWGVLDARSDSSLVIEKPFKTKFGSFVAKIIHNVVSWCYNIYYKNKEST